VLALAFASCGSKADKLNKGEYEMCFFVKDVTIPILLEINDSSWCIHNANETITFTPTWHTADSFFVELPLFNTTLAGRLDSNNSFHGMWNDPSRTKQQTIPFRATYIQPYTPQINNSHQETMWDCTFSPHSQNDRSRAVGIFNSYNGKLTGTFLTETGDYRYLSGRTNEQNLQLSCFDGAHLFYFSANINGDSLSNGRFISGNTWDETWEAKKDPTAQLTDPDSLTQWIGKEKLHFAAFNTRGEPIHFDSTNFKDKVTIIQIFGSWCPNCSDESKFLKELYNTYYKQNLQIIPVAFEREATLEQQIQRVTKQFKDLGITYEPYIGGKSLKSNAHEVFPQLNHVMSYPTTIIIDKKNQVRKIHTGFYGPGTGKYYEHHTELLTMFVAQLLQEN
jgi:thiol-disulfide isomerase/thioredoxin